MDAKQLVLMVINDILDIDDISDLDVPIGFLNGADSMSMLMIISNLESELGTQFPFDELQEVELISDLIALVDSKLND